MRYELDINGYVSTVLWGCGTGNCKEYTGEVPIGYSSLVDWADNACINAYYINSEGNLTLDIEREVELTTKQTLEAIDNTPILVKDMYGNNELLNTQYQRKTRSGNWLLTLSDVKNIAPTIKLTNIDCYKSSTIRIYAHGYNLIKNDGKEETINGVSFIKTIDGAIKINGTATDDIEYNIAGSSTNTTPFCVLKKGLNYYLNIGGYNCEMKYFNGETTEQVYVGASGVIQLSESKQVTQAILKIPKGTVCDNVTIYPMFNYGTTARDYEEYKVKTFTIDFSEYVDEGLFPADDLYPSDDLFPRGTTINYVLIKDGVIYINKNEKEIAIDSGNVQLFNGTNVFYIDQDVSFEIEYSINLLVVDSLEFLQGKSTTSNKFKILEDGSIEAHNGTFSGHVTATSGSFTGDIFLGDGAKVIGGDGMLSNLQFKSTSEYGVCGFTQKYTPDGDVEYPKLDIACNVFIPSNFKVVSAYATIYHSNMNWFNQNNNEINGYCRKIKLYKASTKQATKVIGGYGSSIYADTTNLDGDEITGAFGSSGYTATNTSGNTIQSKTSPDIAEHIETGTNVLFVRTAESTSASSSNWDDALKKTGRITLVVDVYGYMKM